MKAKNLFVILFLIGFLNSNAQEKNMHTEETTPLVINRDNADAVIKFREMDLDSFYDNLLDPRNVSETERQEVVESWRDFHSQITAYLKASNFDWNSDDESIRIMKRIYFSKDGSVNYYVFKIENQTIDAKTKEKFHKIINQFVLENKINFTKDKVFAQCGMVEYTNVKY